MLLYPFLPFGFFDLLNLNMITDNGTLSRIFLYLSDEADTHF